MVEAVGVIMIILLSCGASLILYRLLDYMKNNHYCDRVYAEG
jgi:hypothetical protein